MKTCPTCGAGAFDDAEVCFGCLHRYGEESVRSQAVAPVPAPTRMPVGAGCPATRPEAASSTPPRMSPAAPPLDGAGWVVRFELPGYAPVMEPVEREGGFVVRFQPEMTREPVERRRERIQRGTHAREAPTEGCMSVGAAGRP